MKLSTKPISSPGRTEKFPPPLMRFLRSNVGSRSRGRSRSSPMFVRKKNTAIETQEPSSPKVTCMGQVRVRRNSKQATARPGRAGQSRIPTRGGCKWIRNAMFCHCFSGKLKPKSFRPAWRKWVLFFHFRRKSKIREDLSKTESRFKGKSEDSEQEDEKVEQEAKVSVSSSPPKNALLLTRSRSAPYRSSLLTSRFCGSPLAAEERGEEQRTEQENREENLESETPTSERVSICRDSDQERIIDPEIEENSKEFGGSIKQIIFVKSPNIEESRTEDVDAVRPVILTRCKSEPARTAEKLDPEMIFWKKRRLGSADSCSPHVLIN